MTHPGDALPRLELHQLTPELQRQLGPRVERLGYLGEFFRVAGVQPDALSGFVTFTESLKDALPSAITEVVALTVACQTGNAYEQCQHERLSLALGQSREWIQDVLRLSPDTAIALDDRERAVQRLALGVLEMLATGGYARPDDELGAVIAMFATDDVVAVLMSIARYVAHSAVVQTLGLAPPVESPLGAVSP